MPSRICPMCFEGSIIRYNHRTCSSECGRAWVKLSRAEQAARLKEAEERPSELLKQISNIYNGVNLIEKARNESRKDRPTDIEMPKSILGEEPEPSLPLPSSPTRKEN